jgi:Xaa-Pro dipeptidase
MQDRVRRLFGRLREPLDAALFLNAQHPHLDMTFYYVSGLAAGLFEGCAAIALPDGELRLLTNPLEAETAGHAEQALVEVVKSRDEMPRALREHLPSQGKIGLNFRELTHEWFVILQKELPGATFVDISEAVRRARAVKDAREVQTLREAGKIVSRVAELIPQLLREGLTEIELATEIEHEMGRRGAAGRSFDTIVAFGPHSAEPHYAPGPVPLRSGDFVVCDFGALHRHYCSDLTRSYFWGDPEPKAWDDILRVVLRAQEAALALVRAGVPAREVHMAAARVIDSSPFRGLFTHNLGHSIGLTVHDGFSLTPRTEDPLEAGMCLTVEPGIYIPGRGGIRIEDDILVTDAGFEFLTDAPRSFPAIRASGQ